MSFLKKLFGANDPPLPEWASVIKPKDFPDFEKHVREAVSHRAPGATFDFQEGTFTTATGDEVFGLHNIVRIVAQTPKIAWKSTINDFFGHMWDIEMVDKKMMDYPFEDLKSRIRLRIYSQDMPRDGMILYPEGPPDLPCAACLDLPNSVSTFNAEKLEQWGITTEELFALAAENTWNHCRLDERSLFDEKKAPTLYLYSSEHFFGASRALFLNRFIDPWPAFGVAYAIPTRDLCFIQPLQSAQDLNGIGYLQQLTGHIFHEEPGGICPLVTVHTGETQFMVSADNAETRELIEKMRQAP